MNDSAKTDRCVYGDQGVYDRLQEYLGGGPGGEATAVYVTHTDGCRVQVDHMKPVDEICRLMDEEWDIDRSLLDREALLVHLDIEYVNFDSPAECYLNPERSFKMQEPVVDAVEACLCEYGIRPLHLLTGQGHHFVWKMGEESDAVSRLSSLLLEKSLVGAVVVSENSLELKKYTRKWEKAFHGLGLVMEFLAHEIKRSSALHSSIPVEITAVNVGVGPHGYREMVSIDISEYGDPLWTRVIRLPFSNYLKPWRSELFSLDDDESPTAPIFTIPFQEMDTASALQIRNSAVKTIELAHRACVAIPEQSQGMNALIDTYMDSSLREFHERYETESRVTDPVALQAMNYVPPCMAHIIGNPNDLLLKPSGMRLVVRSLLSLGVPPRCIASIIAGIFGDEQYGWSCQWDLYSSDMRADFYTRLFAGQIATGLDEGVDFNCVSTQEQGFCFDADGCDLKPWRDKLAATQKQG